MATANDLNISQSGIVAFDGTATFSGRTLTPGTGISITNGNGVSGNPVISVSGTTSGNRNLIQTINANSNSFIDFTTGISGYDLYEIDFYSVLTTGVVDQGIQFSTDSGATWANSNYNSSYVVAYPNTGGTGGMTSQTKILISSVTTDSSTLPWNGTITFHNLGSNSLNKSLLGMSIGQFNGSLLYPVAGYWLSSSIVNGIRFNPNGGTFVSGVFKLYGVVN